MSEKPRSRKISSSADPKKSRLAVAPVENLKEKQVSQIYEQTQQLRSFHCCISIS